MSEAKVEAVTAGVAPDDAGPVAAAPADSRPADVGRAEEWHERWVGWASWPANPAVLSTAALALAVDVGSAWVGVAEWHLGRIPVSPAVPLALLLVVQVGARAMGLTRAGLRAWREFLVGAGAVAAIAAFACASTPFGWRGVAGVLLAAIGEEVVYRLGAVLLVGAACARLAGREWRDTSCWGSGPAVAGVVGAAVIFSVLPGHVSQMAGITSVLPFVSLAALLGYVALRSGALVPCAVVHLLLDLVALTFLAGSLTSAARLVVATAALVGLAGALMPAGRRLGQRRRVPDVIDLRVASGP